MHHTLLGFCWWDLPAAIILIGLAVLFFIKHRRMKKRIKELEDKLNSLFEETVDVDKGI